MNACKNCGSVHAVTKVKSGPEAGRLWCSICGYWADCKKPETTPRRRSASSVIHRPARGMGGGRFPAA